MADGKRSSKQGKTCHLLNVKNPTRVAERLKLNFQRVDAKLFFTKAGKEVDVGLTLLDVSESGAGLYAGQMLSKGATVELSIFEPRILKVRGTIAWCVPAESKMNSLVVRYPFRCGIQFVFESEVQRVAVVEFIQKIRDKKGFNEAPKVVAPPLAAQADLPSDAITPPAESDAPPPAAEAVAAPTAPTAPAASASEAPAAAPEVAPTAAPAAEATEATAPTDEEKKAA